MVRNGWAEVPGLESLPLVDTYKVAPWALNSVMVRNDINLEHIVLTFMPTAWGNSATQAIASRLIRMSVSRCSRCPSLSDSGGPLTGFWPGCDRRHSGIDPAKCSKPPGIL